VFLTNSGKYFCSQRRRDTTEGFFSRWVVIPFTAFFPAGKADPTLIERLTRVRVLQGLLRASVGGLQSVMRRGAFDIPPSVASATERFKMEADPLRGFIEERVVSSHPSNPSYVPRTQIYDAYSAWASTNGFHQMSAQRFYEQFTAAAVDTLVNPFAQVVRDGVKVFKGIELR
jgi:putative DNA primase/helicase